MTNKQKKNVRVGRKLTKKKYAQKEEEKKGRNKRRIDKGENMR